MKVLTSLFFLSCLMLTVMNAQEEKLPFYEIPPAPEKADANGVLARMIDGLGYRYYWATEELTENDLNYTPGNLGMRCDAVLEHLKNLSGTIKNTVMSQANVRPLPDDELTWEEIRSQTLHNLKAASDYLRTSKANTEEIKMIFQRGEKTSEFPIWNLLNGPLADAIYHVGQVVSYRRSAGNPINPKVNVFTGKTNG